VALRTVIIAEAGVNHNGDMALAKRLVDAAAEAGADHVKFQTFSADRIALKNAGKAGYQKLATASDESMHGMLSRLELSAGMHEELISDCRAKGISFLSTAFDIESVDLLAGFGLELFKIPSGEITNLPYLRHIARLGKPVILSTGMSTMEEIGAALQVIEGAGLDRENITVLHCTTEYPAPFAEANLAAMLTIRQAFGVKVGYSDHTPGIEISVAAVAMGAAVIEKHLTLDRGLPGPDHSASLEPLEFKSMVAAIRNVETALGDGVKRPTPGEARNIQVARKSLVASHPIKAGELFTAENVTAKRPATGISPMRWDDVIGQKAQRDFSVDDPIIL
jgi:N,N'-diacetyllegionaminate synthase